MPDQRLPPKRMKAADRREAIIDAAATLFAQNGFDSTTTQSIARQAGVSEALLYRHFRSKELLFRSVLRKLIAHQDLQLAAAARDLEDALSYVRSIRTYLAAAIARRNGDEAAMGHKLLIASMIGDGIYARLIYRRALRKRQPTAVAVALDRARQEGLSYDGVIHPANAFFFIGHIGSMLMLSHLSGKSVIPYAGDADTLLRDAVTFCTRGVGICDSVVERLYAEDEQAHPRSAARAGRRTTTRRATRRP